MKRSFVVLVVRSVLIFWLLGLVSIIAYVSTRTWSEAHARADGVFLTYELLDATPSAQRAARLKTLQGHADIDYAILSADEVARRFGRTLTASAHTSHMVWRREWWYLLAFSDGSAVLVAGPVNPIIPRGQIPIGIFISIAVVPLLGALWASRLERELAKVERASQALAVGQLDVRVDNERGPSRELATSFNEMAERVEALIRSRDELVQAVSHELGSPLARLRLHLGLLEDELDGAHHERLDGMSSALDALDELVAELLHYIQSDERAIEPQTFEPTRLLADLAELACLELPDDREVEVRVDVVSGAQVCADPRLFQRAVENVLRNAARYARGQIWLEVTEEGGAVHIAVHDDGPGIAEALREQVVLPFVRLDAARGRGTGGVGLGLAIVTRILDRHGGQLTIDTSPLGGALVVTRWPAGP